MAITYSKIVQIEHMRCFLTSKFSIDVKNTSYAQFGQNLSKLWPFENSNFSEVPNLWVQFRLTRPKLSLN